ncbi:MAG: penicillin-binding transpeptidase domain-containing protein [Anaerovoracaceae bacterium]
MKKRGELDMNQAMACSCNCYFAQLGQLAGCGEIVKTAAKLGLGSQVLKDYPQEASGNIPDEDEVGPWDTTNISIGQGAILTTPLQIARMTAIVACGGRDVEPVLETGQAGSPGRRIISEETAKNWIHDAGRDDSGTGAGVPIARPGKTEQLKPF